MYWKDSFFDALFPIDNRVISLPYCLKRPSKRDEYLDVLIPNRKKVNVELAFKILEQNLPNKVYKYRTFSEYSLLNFRNDTIWMTNPVNFNDPFDSISIDSDISLKELYDIWGNNIKQMVMNDGRKDVDRDIYDKYKSIISQEKLEELNKIIKWMTTERTQHTFKVACLSETNTSVLLWSHYSNDHKGFCIEYDGQEIYNSKLIKKRFFPVKYIDKNEGRTPISALALDYPGLYSVLCKTNEWSYEKEWRICFGIEENIKYNNIQLPKSTGVYIGAKMPDEHRKTIINIAEAKSIPIYQEVLEFPIRSVSFEKIM